MSDLPEIPSPCMGVCRLDKESRLCVGCLRNVDEIRRWRDAGNDERLAMLNILRERRRALGRTSAADSRTRRRKGKPDR